MAKSILQIFGGGTIAIGILVMVLGLVSANSQGLIVTLPIGAGLLVAGAPLLGFARVIELLEGIYANTGSPMATAKTELQRNEAAGIRSHIRRYKPAFSTSMVYETDITGETKRFNTDAEALAFVSAHLRDGR